jgi:uncharacterized protein YdaL
MITKSVLVKRTSVFWLLSLLFLAACSGTEDPQQERLSSDANALVLNSSSVLLLYNDSSPTFQSQSLRSPSREVTPGQFLHPGLPNTEPSSAKTGFGPASLQAASAYSYPDAAQVYAIMVANLVGRYSTLTPVIQSVSSYQAGQAKQALRTFYIGSTYGDPVPDALISDIMQGAPVTWLNYQIWQLDRPTLGASLAQLGLSYVGLNAEYDPAQYTTGFNTINYRNYAFKKFLAPMEMIEVAVTGPNVIVHAEAVNSAGRKIPYALQSGNFWYFADLPLSYITETDRYLVFADLLGPMLGRDQTCEPRAVARMEDLSPNDNAADLRRMLDSIRRVNIPFAAATIPLYKNNTTGTTRTWQQNSTALTQLRRVPNMKGRIFQHGYTHQYEGLNNPFGETGVDFEFWQATDNGSGGFNYIGPIPGQTPASALQRVQSGRTLLVGLGLSPSGWVTPHYAADPSFYTGFNTVYPRVMERRLYRVGSVIAGQFFPYPVKDVAGTLIIPETLGSLQPGYLLDKVMAAARANRALRCPWAGHFFHAYTLNPQYTGTNAITPARFEQLLRDIQALGYRYVDPNTVTQQ